MRRNFRKIIAFALSSAMMIGSPISILADETRRDTVSGVGQMEGLTKPDVYQVILPTDVNGVFDFVMDPQKLIEKTNAAVYGGKTYEKGATVFFHRSDGQTADEYCSSSDHVTIINRSTVPVDVLVNVSISPDSLGSITMTNDREFTNDTSTSLYMALTDEEQTVPIGTEGSYIQATIPAAPEDAFEYSYNQERGEYSYGLKEDLNSVEFPEYSFQLTGAVNEKGDWSTVRNAALLVNVTWEVTPGQNLDSGESKNAVQDESSERDLIFSQTMEKIPVEKEAQEEEDVQNNISRESTAPNIVKTSYTLKAGKPLSIDVDLGSGSAAATKIVSVKWKETDNELLGTEDEADAVRYQDGKLTFSGDWVNECLTDVSKEQTVLVVTFDDAGETEEEIVLRH